MNSKKLFRKKSCIETETSQTTRDLVLSTHINCLTWRDMIGLSAWS